MYRAYFSDEFILAKAQYAIASNFAAMKRIIFDTLKSEKLFRGSRLCLQLENTLKICSPDDKITICKKEVN